MGRGCIKGSGYTRLGCDLVKLLQWSDLNDGQLQKQYEEYVNHLGSEEHSSNELTHILEDITKDLHYVQSVIED